MKRTHYEQLCDTVTLARRGKLDASKRFEEEDVSILAGICNGCGAADAKFDFVPDTIYGLSIRPACQIHDFDYHIGQDIEYKKMADRRFFNNMFRLIELGSANRLIKILRRKRALKYYNAVDMMGGSAFWGGKNS